MGVGHHFMQIIHMSIMYNKQRNELHISAYMKDICIIIENYIMGVYLKNTYIHSREQYIYIYQKGALIIYK